MFYYYYSGRTLKKKCYVGPDGVPVPVRVPVPVAGQLRRLLPALPGTQGLVLLGRSHALQLHAHIRYVLAGFFLVIVHVV